MVGVKAIFDLAVPEEIERPADGVADNVGREAPVECAYAALVACDVTGDAKRVPQA